MQVEILLSSNSIAMDKLFGKSKHQIDCKYCNLEANSTSKLSSFSDSVKPSENPLDVRLNSNNKNDSKISHKKSGMHNTSSYTETIPSAYTNVNTNSYNNTVQSNKFNINNSSYNSISNYNSNMSCQGKRHDLFLPLYYTNYYADQWAYWNEETTRIKLAGAKSNIASQNVDEKKRRAEKSPLFIDDVRSAALALTSLSLSPGNTHCSSTDDAGDKKDWSSINYFIFPPTNTPTSDPTTPKTDVITTSPSTPSSTPHYFHGEHTLYSETENYKYPVIKKRHDSSDSDEIRYHGDQLRSQNRHQLLKPRSYSTRDFDRESTHPVPIVTKPRSYSFDAVGRASKPEDYIREPHVGYHSAPLSQSRMLQGKLGSSSGDDGIGSSCGSTESIEHVPIKRKITSRTVFRCMWRGCDKELTTLPGIILHVRHAHIGTSNAGEEEFYFNDVNLDSSTTSGVSSSSVESIPDECSKRKYRKSVSEETLENVDVEKSLDNTFVEDVHFGVDQEPKKEIVENHQEKNNVSVGDANKIEKVRQDYFPAEKVTKKPTQHLIENLLSDNKTQKITSLQSAHHQINSPSFNIDFINHFQDNVRIFAPTDVTPKRRSKGRKKCRKVYGMSNKDLWCTQCRWKKACTRFT